MQGACLISKKSADLLLYNYATHRAALGSFLSAFAAFGADHLGNPGVFVHGKNLGAHLSAYTTADAFFLINRYTHERCGHLLPSEGLYISRRISSNLPRLIPEVHSHRATFGCLFSTPSSRSKAL